MDKKIAGMLGAAAGLAAIGSANAASLPRTPSEAMRVSSYADLLAPVPNPVAQLKADNAARAQARVTQTADFYFSYGYRTPYRYAAPYYAGMYRPDYHPRYDNQHHHHHHHHHHFREDWR